MTETLTFVNYLSLEFDVAPGRELKIRPWTAKNGNTYYFVAKFDKKGNRVSAAPYGSKVKPLANELPSVAMVHGAVIDLKRGVTKDSGNPRVRGSQSVLIDGEKMTLTVQVSLLPDGQWNVIAGANRAGGGSNREAADVDDL